jgi:glycosyltransferase involved in cell wall biosynthesis
MAAMHKVTPQFVVATPQRSVCDDHARALDRCGRLRFLALGTRRGTQGIPPERTRLNPWIGLYTYAAECVLSMFLAESFRFRLLPWFDRWVLKQLQPGDHIISSYGYANECFKFVHRHGGKTFVDAGNSHIENFWELLTEEHRRWNCHYPPVARHWYERSRAMLAETDYVLSPSSYVTQSFLDRGFRPDQILPNAYPVNLSLFQPSAAPRPKDRPLTIINTGTLSLRKGTPYLLEAFRLVHRQHPSARLLLTRSVRNDVEPILARYGDLPIEWAAPALPHAQLADRLRSADVFVLPSIEEGLARTALEAMACGLQVVLTPNTGTSDFVQPGVSGEIVPIRDPAATAAGILKCWERARQNQAPDIAGLRQKLSFDTFAKNFISQLAGLGLCE